MCRAVQGEGTVHMNRDRDNAQESVQYMCTGILYKGQGRTVVVKRRRGALYFV